MVKHAKKGTKLIPFCQHGGSPYSHVNLAPRRKKQDNHLVDYPNGMNLEHIGIGREGAKQPLQRYTNSDSPMIASALTDAYENRGDIMNGYNLSPDEFMNLLANTHGILYQESNGGYPLYLSSNGPKYNETYAKNHLNPYYNYARHITNSLIGRETSEGLGSVKRNSFENSRPKLEYNNLDPNSSTYGGLSTI